MGPNRATVIGLHTEFDHVLSVVAPVGLAAASARPALVIDLDPGGPMYPGPRSLAELVVEGPTRSELFPRVPGAHRPRVALLRNGGVGWEPAISMIEALAKQWPALVLRLPGTGGPWPWPVVPVVPLHPGILQPAGGRAAVWQSVTSRRDIAPGPGPVLPALDRSALSRMLTLRTEPRGRWVRAWSQVWELPWP
ncbi:MAG: hypothetical protein WD313_06915 [Acidimicrobiia bacterium]